MHNCQVDSNDEEPPYLHRFYDVVSSNKLNGKVKETFV